MLGITKFIVKYIRGNIMPKQKYKIEENSVQETLILPLYGKKLYTDAYPDLLNDPSGNDLINNLNYDFSKKYADGGKGFSAKIGTIQYGHRVRETIIEIKNYLKDHPNATIVNMGCGLDTTYRMAWNDNTQVLCIDFPDVIDIRNQLLPPSEQETYLAGNLNDYEWFEKVNFNKEDGVIFYALGVFFYFQRIEVKNLFDAMAKTFPGGRLCFDATNSLGLKIMLKDYLKKSGMNTNAYFCLKNPEKELKTFSNHFRKVSTHGLFEGYFPMDDRYGLKIKLMGKIMGDKMKMSQYNVIDFKE